MPLPFPNKGLLMGPDARFAPVGIFLLETLLSNALGAWAFNKYDGETDRHAADRCSQNLIWGAPNFRLDRQYPNGIPTINADYFRFYNHSPLQTRIPMPERGCCFSIARTLDDTIGDTGLDRAMIAGSFGDNIARGLCTEFSSWSSGQSRAFVYGVTDPTTPVVSTVGTAANDLGKWRLWFTYWNASAVAHRNQSGDGSTPAPTPASVSGGAYPGVYNWHIGGRAPAGSASYNNNHKDIAFHMLFDDIPDQDQIDIIEENLDGYLAETGLVYLEE